MNAIRQIDPAADTPFLVGCGVYALTTQGSYCYLIVGEQAALVVDTGFGTVNVKELAESVTDKKLLLVNTHGHLDHIGCDELFDSVYAHPMEAERIRRKNISIVEVAEDFRFDLGGRTLEVLELPGHTPGGIGLLDRRNRILFSGDMVGDRPLFLQFEYSSLNDYIQSMDKILRLRDEVDYLFCCHGTAVMALDQAEETRSLAQQVLSGNVESSDGSESAKNAKHLSAASLDVLTINTAIPMLFAVGRHRQKEEYCDRAFDFLEQLKAERNHIVKMWAECGLETKTAGDSQALIQLKREYCDKRDCLRCRFGYEYLRCCTSPLTLSPLS